MTNPRFITTTLAMTFAKNLKRDIGVNALRIVNAKNLAATDPNVCVSHDVCDANEPMAEAFLTVMGREIDLQSDADCTVWNAAWDEAKAAKFYLTRPLPNYRKEPHGSPP